ncbi:MAG: sigma-54 dependent transcriptional regulator [Gammaproteobacteria bacterium]|jgi:DNA-binding NtrC family response regulator
MAENILIVEDEETLRENLARYLAGLGHNVRHTASTEEATSLIDKESFDIILTDMRLGDGNGLDLLQEISRLAPFAVTMIMTAYSSTESAVAAFRRGAHDYLVKPICLDELSERINNIAKYRGLVRQNTVLRQEIQRRHNPLNIVSRSRIMAQLLQIAGKVAQSASNVLVTGESGTGKELIARAVHDLSPNRDAAFIPLNVAAIPDTLLENYLFGHRRGAFTGADRAREGAFRAAGDGTLFLDEIGDLPIHLQPKLLRALEEKEILPVGSDHPIHVNTRVVAATHRDLDTMVEQGKFRHDLLMRLNVVELHIPPLRERPEDIPLLVNHFILAHCNEMGTPIRHIDEDAMKCLISHEWRKGNVRELSNVLERAVLLCEDETIHSSDLPMDLREDEEHAPLALKAAVRRFEHQHVASVLETVEGNREAAAQLLGVSSATLYRHMERLGLKGYQAHAR